MKIIYINRKLSFIKYACTYDKFSVKKFPFRKTLIFLSQEPFTRNKFSKVIIKI